MNSSLAAILNELYSIDPELRKHEAELLPLLTKLLEHRPHITPDERFVRELRSQLLARADAVPAHSSLPLLSAFLDMYRFPSVIAGILVGIMVTVPLTYVFLRSQQALPPGNRAVPLISYSVQKETTRRAFGDLKGIAESAFPAGRGGGGGGGDAAALPPANLQAPEASEGDSADSKAMPVDLPSPMIVAPEWTQFEYVFEGEMPELPASVDVLQRQKNIPAPGVSAILKSFNVGMVDLTSFPGSTIQSISFAQEQDYGYTAHIDFQQGQIGIGQNWVKWPHPELRCRDEACYRQYRVQIGDIPADGAVTRIAGDFLAAHGIDLARYGAPEVDKAWRLDYERMADKSQVYIPESVRVIYPLLIEDKPVYDMGGMKTGISVGVHVKERRVTDVWGIQSLSYRSSAYEGVTGAAAIRSYLRKLEQYPMPLGAERGQPEPKATKIQVALGAPRQGFMLYYMPDGVDGKELLVPALLFPVTEKPDGQPYFRSVVTVPLAKDILENKER